MFLFEIQIVISIILDLLFGDPRWYPHPVKLIGLVTQSIEKATRKLFPNILYFAGFLTTFLTLLFVTGSVSGTFYFLGKLSIYYQFLAAILLLYSLIAIKDLLLHSKNVYKCLSPEEKIEEARSQIALIVGRDTQKLGVDGICRACVETVAENMVDGITAPLFYAILFSLFSNFTPFSPIAMAAIGMTTYKTINTMDSMFGYKNARYYEFGWVPAKLDDVANFIPSRISGVFIILTAFFLGKNFKNSMVIFMRDRKKHSSPNAGHTESALAGALDIRLGGMSYYFGEKVNKPVIGEPVKDIEAKHIILTNKIILYSSLAFFSISLIARKVCIWLTVAL